MGIRRGLEDFDRRRFMKMAATTGVGVAATTCFPNEFMEAVNAAPVRSSLEYASAGHAFRHAGSAQ